ncbi:RNA pyrophosphohydrolase [Chelatococcus sp. GCM10030263]|uniref:RNA pyrophosphohydrolase n=1 Tax=Chelatococcus sp. GCM10030263 TaxID=3273387 RepID=UPI00361BC2D7
MAKEKKNRSPADHGRGFKDPTGLPYRPCVGVMLLNARGEVFLGRRAAENDPEQVTGPFAWQMPQGGIDEGEEPFEAACRELYEETNVRSVELLAEAPEWFNYDLPPELVGIAWKGRFRGQTQKWFALRFTGDEDEIEIHRPAGGTHKPEFDAWRWEAMERLPDLVVPFKRPVYQQVVATFAKLAVR